jgi:ubiquinone/menaquinone biosynthesis C-methylase UbiE
MQRGSFLKINSATDEFYKDYLHEDYGTPYVLKQLMRFVPQQGARILDVGCGAARKSVHFRRGGGNRVVGIDISTPMIEKAKEILDEAYVHNISDGLPFGDSTFDVVYCAMVLEHLFDYMGPLKEMNRVLKPGGRILIEVPNVNYWPNRLLMLFGRNLIWIGVGKHIRAFNKHYLQDALMKAGFSAVHITGSILPLPKTALKVHLPYLNRLLPGLCFSLIGTGHVEAENV